MMNLAVYQAVSRVVGMASCQGVNWVKHWYLGVISARVTPVTLWAIDAAIQRKSPPQKLNLYLMMVAQCETPP